MADSNTPASLLLPILVLLLVFLAAAVLAAPAFRLPGPGPGLAR